MTRVYYRICPTCKRNKAPAGELCPSCVAAGKGQVRHNQKAQDKFRGSSNSRGYDKDWRRVRIEVKEDSGWLCQCDRCKAMGRIRAVKVGHPVHHIKPISTHPHLRLDKRNLCSMRWICHEVEHGRKRDHAYEAWKRENTNNNMNQNESLVHCPA